MRHSPRLRFAWLIAALASMAGAAQAGTTLLNASYDVTREFFKDYNPLFIEHWKTTMGETLVVNQSHGGSSKQARSVADGLAADVVTFNQSTDIDFLAGAPGLVAKDWETKFPQSAAPFTSTIVFVVRKGNPKAIRDWSDLAKADVAPIIPNPKTSGNGRYSYLAAWGWALRQPDGSPEKAKAFVAGLFRKVPVLDTGGRGATTTFAQRGIGDVLLTFENEAHLTAKELGADKVEIIWPSVSIVAESPVAVVDGVVDRRGTRKQATAYLEYLYSPAAQELAAKHGFRPRNAGVLARHAELFKPITLLSIAEVAGTWAAAQQTHFAEGGLFDQIYAAK